MTKIEVNHDGFVVDAVMLAEAFRLDPQDVQPLMRSGEITCLSETGVGEDAGQSRLTFHFGGRTLRLVVDQTGEILKRVSFSARSRMSIAADMFPIPAEDKVKATS